MTKPLTWKDVGYWVTILVLAIVVIVVCWQKDEVAEAVISKPNETEITAFSNDLLYKMIEQSWVEIARRNGESRCPKCYTFYEGSNMKGILCSMHTEPNETDKYSINIEENSECIFENLTFIEPNEPEPSAREQEIIAGIEELKSLAPAASGEH